MTAVPATSGSTDRPAATGAPDDGDALDESDEPEGTADADETEDPEPSATPLTGSEAACTGTDENRDFYTQLAAAVSWPVYCAVLPRGWYVHSGQYRLAHGGRMEISYRGPDGAGLRLQQGAICEGGCVPAGEDLGPAAFGDREATLYSTDGGWTIAADDDSRIGWLLVVTGVSEGRARAFAEDLARVGD